MNTENRAGDETKEKAMPPPKGIASRRLAMEVLIKVECEGAYANLALASAFKRKSLSQRDRAFVTALVQGVLRCRSQLDQWLSQISSQPLEKMPASLRNLLRLSLFQIEHMEDIPQSAVVDTCSRLARATGHVGQVKFANGVLRSYLRKRSTLSAVPSSITDAKTLATCSSMPVWLVERWINEWGLDEARLLLEHSQRIPELTLRACQLSITADGLHQILEANGMQVRRGRLVDSCLIIEARGGHKGPVSKLPGFEQGLFAVQDEPSAFVCRVVAPEAGELVVDLCAAPGGKSLYLAELMEGKGKVIAVDSHSGRLRLLRESRNRLGLTNIEIVVADACTYVLDGLADRVLLDAPCTGTGVINRRSDLRYHRDAPDLLALVQLQREMLTHAAKLVRPGGVLVYSTCSIEPEENRENIDWFLSQNADFKPESIKPFLPGDLARQWVAAGGEGYDKWLQLLPSRHGLSGFFIARLRRDR